MLNCLLGSLNFEICLTNKIFIINLPNKNKIYCSLWWEIQMFAVQLLYIPWFPDINPFENMPIEYNYNINILVLLHTNDQQALVKDVLALWKVFFPFSLLSCRSSRGLVR